MVQDIYTNINKSKKFFKKKIKKGNLKQGVILKLFINFYLVFSILISTTFSNILIAKMFESGSFQKICSYSGDKILLPNGKLIDENKFHEECDICINCFPDFSLNLIKSDNFKNFFISEYENNFSQLIFSKNFQINTIRGPPIN